MRKLAAVLAMLVMASWTWAAEASSSHKILFRDYGITDAPKVGALSVGVCSWTDSKSDLTGGAYWDFKFVELWNEKLNFGVGMCFVPPREDSLMDMRLETSVTTHLFNCLELGAWYAPFWSLMGKDDPYGLMVGYYWKF